MKLTVIQHISGTDYTLLKRESKYEPYILAYYFNPDDSTWCQGHYFETIYGVEAYLNQYLENGYVFDSDIVRYEVFNGTCILPYFKEFDED